MNGRRYDSALKDLQEAEAVVRAHYGEEFLRTSDAASIVVLVAIMQGVSDVRHAVTNYTP